MTGSRVVVIAPDKFKGSLTAAEATGHLAEGVRRSAPEATLRLAPVADGGDGTVQALLASGFERVPVTVQGPTGQPVPAAFARRGDTAVVELAEASGMRRLAAGRADPLEATTWGTGELIRAALDGRCRRLVLGVGGSASTDGGAGMLQALGARLVDAHDQVLPPGGGALASLDSVDLTGLDPRLGGLTVILASDVDNPLLGDQGTARVYAAQKGADRRQVEWLEASMRVWSTALAAASGRDEAATPGAGAAGGVGVAALAVLHADRRPGVDVVLELIGFDDLLSAAGLVITGEGSLDAQTLRGKAPGGVAAAAVRRGVPTIALVGQSSLTPDQVARAGLVAAYPLTDLEPDLATCQREAGRLLEQLAADVVTRHLPA